MADLLDFKRGKIVRSRMAGASVTKTAALFGAARSTLSKVMTTFKKDGKTSPQKKNSERKRKLSNRDRQTLTRIVSKDYKNTCPNITAEINDRLLNTVSSKTVRSEMHKTRLHGRATIRKRN